MDDNWLDDIELGGIGGPICFVSKIRIPTEQGSELRMTDLQLIVVDIDPSIDGLWGAEMLASGWIDAALGGGPDGCIEMAHFDFTNAANFDGRWFDVIATTRS